MSSQKLWWLAITLCLIVTTYSFLSPRQRRLIWQRLRLIGRDESFASTLRSTAQKSTSKSLASSASDIGATFPPSQRDRLEEIASTLSDDQRNSLGDLIFDKDSFSNALLEFDEDYATAEPTKYCFSGFSVREIKALGNFPDYAALSEVPLPEPYKEFDIDRALPRPYRPFRWSYHQTMSLTKLENNWWIELENTYKSRIAQRRRLYAEHGEAVLQWLPGSELACKELMEMVVQFVCARYPQYFILSDDKKILENKILGVKTAVHEKHPLLVLLDHIPEDFALMIRNPETGYYYFRAGMICSALGWNVATKIGLQLHQIHEPIPDYKDKMQFSMDRFFTKMPASKPIQRGSWGLEVDQPLYMPPGDPHEKYRAEQNPDLTVDRINLRVDWQTLRRLPLSGAIVFNFKAVFSPLAEFRDEAYIPSLLLHNLRHAKKNLMEYKNTWHTEHVVIPALEQFEKEQKENGIVEKDWEPQTLDESPWFPGWQEKWHRQQGF